MSELRQASEQDLAHKSIGAFGFLQIPSLRGLGASVFALAPALIFLTCSLVLDQEYVGTYESDVAQPRVSDRRVVSLVSQIVSLRESWVGPLVTGRVG